MNEAEVYLRNGSALLLGVGGSGKRHFLAAFLKEDSPLMRESTSCAKIPVRAVAHCKARVFDDHFVRVTDDHYSDMLVTTAMYSTPCTYSETVVNPPPAEAERALYNIYSSPGEKEMTMQSLAVKVDASRRDKTMCVHRAMKRQYLSRMQAGVKFEVDLNNKELLDINETGGQPMFHEVLPVFIQNTILVVLIVKLNEPLDSFPIVEYYGRGERIGEPFSSPLTHLDTLRHCMRVIVSTCDRSTYPKIAFVGTHKDLQHECPHESREMKEMKLRRIIPPEIEDNVIIHGDSMLLAVNVRIPGNDDEEVMSILRKKAITELRKLKPKTMPLRYITLETAFLQMAKEQQKSVLSKYECFEVAATYNFSQESFESALKYLHALKVVFYYKEVLPNIVFIDAQAILDKITELAVHSLSLQAKSGGLLLGALKTFVRCGIVTGEILEDFSSHYVPKLFMKEQLLLLLKYLGIIAEVGEGKYLMPCLLRKQNVPHLMPNASLLVIPDLLFYFGEDGPKLGVYCFLLASLITEAKWELLEEDGDPVQVARNRVQFALPGKNPGCVTISDPFSSYFHVDIELHPEGANTERMQQIYAETCPIIRETILTGIRKASQRLNYNDSIPEIAFPCTKHDNLHPARISGTGNFLICTSDRRVFSEVTEQHMFWIGHKGTSKLYIWIFFM